MWSDLNSSWIRLSPPLPVPLPPLHIFIADRTTDRAPVNRPSILPLSKFDAFIHSQNHSVTFLKHFRISFGLVFVIWFNLAPSPPYFYFCLNKRKKFTKKTHIHTQRTQRIRLCIILNQITWITKHKSFKEIQMRTKKKHTHTQKGTNPMEQTEHFNELKMWYNYPKTDDLYNTQLILPICTIKQMKRKQNKWKRKDKKNLWALTNETHLFPFKLNTL